MIFRDPSTTLVTLKTHDVVISTVDPMKNADVPSPKILKGEKLALELICNLFDVVIIIDEF